MYSVIIPANSPITIDSLRTDQIRRRWCNALRALIRLLYVLWPDANKTVTTQGVRHCACIGWMILDLLSLLLCVHLLHDLLFPSVTWTTSFFSFCSLWCTNQSSHHSPHWQTPTAAQCEGTGYETPAHMFLPAPRPLAPSQHGWSLSSWSCSSVEVCLRLCWSVCGHKIHV